MPGKPPAFQFYPGDWLRDPQIRMVSYETKGFWIDMLCLMWFSKTRGKLEGNVESLSRLLGCDIETFKRILIEIKNTGIATVKITEINNSLSTANEKACNANVTPVTFLQQKSTAYVTVINRRMYREQQERDKTRVRVYKHRHKDDVCNTECNDAVTLPSSSSTSFSLNTVDNSTISEISSNVYKESLNNPPLIPPSDEVGKIKRKSKKKAVRVLNYTDSFNQFWALYPHKKNKADAFESWQAIGEAKITTVKTIMESLKLQVENGMLEPKGKNSSGLYPSTWLNNHRWEDEIKNERKKGLVKDRDPNDYSQDADVVL